MSKADINDLISAAKKAGKTADCTRCKKPMIYCGKQPAPAELAVCAECVKNEAEVTP